MRPRLLAIDWSGARRAKGISVAALEPRGAPKLLSLPNNNNWTREDVFELLKTRAAEETPTIAGIDCNFSLPFTDCGEYLPELPAASAYALWAEVESVCRNDSDFYGGAFSCSHKSHFLTSGTKNYEFRFRATEEMAKVCGVKPQSPFNLAQRQMQVGLGGLAGMRMLHYLKMTAGANVAVWPFDRRIESAPLTVVEIFPTLYRYIADMPDKISPEDVNTALERLGSKQFSGDIKTLADEGGDKTDALISVAGMARTLISPYAWTLRGRNIEACRTEGWIFGVPWTGTASTSALNNSRRKRGKGE